MTKAPEHKDQEFAGLARRNDAVLTETVRQVDIVHTSLAGMTAIVLMLLAAVALPVFGHNPVTQPLAFWIMTATSFVGIAGLYLLNFRVHHHVTEQARITEVLVNSLGQGFLFFDRNGMCGNVYSQVCIDLLESVPSGKNIADVLKVPASDRDDFKDWIDVLFQPDHALGFDDVVRFLPQFFAHNQERRIALMYKPINDKNGHLHRVVLIATDQTEEYAARQMARRQQNFAEMICRIFKDRNQFQSTLAHVREFLDEARKPNWSIDDSAQLQRKVHTLKAAVKQFNLIDFGEVMHVVENELRDPDITTDEAFRRRLAESCQKIEGALKRVTEEVNSLLGAEYEWRGNVREIGEEDIYDFARVLKDGQVGHEVVKDYMLRIAAVPIRDCFHSFERELRELAAVMDKQVKPIKFLGSNPKVLTRPIQEFLFSLTHISRNIVDHGLEAPVTRMARGKDAAGQVTITCDIINGVDGVSDWLRLQIADDGNGIDPSRVRAKLYSMDPEGDWRFEDDQTVIQRIFKWNFTTSESVTAISGRGIGMEAVETEVKKLGGTIRVSSQLYQGSVFDMRIPYLLDIETETKKPFAKQNAL
ncbi:MAG: ATP-binding protein [Alphaproteobacteria bacterium]|jgi:two-component system chemotaxis sensor kinase CheA|nr:ATP-binding protein [Alphaproteobacteria bacterium]